MPADVSPDESWKRKNAKRSRCRDREDETILVEMQAAALFYWSPVLASWCCGARCNVSAVGVLPVYVQFCAVLCVVDAVLVWVS